jgi:hypothetical protein
MTLQDEPRAQPASSFSSILAGLALLASSLAVGLALPLARTFHRLPINYNEGVMAYLADRAVHGGLLYPPVGDWTTNNYTPLSYYAVGGLGLFTGDNILAGRLISWIAFFWTTFTIGRIAWKLRPNIGSAIFAAGFFAATLATNFSDYLGMNDPHMLGLAVMTTGFAALIGAVDRPGRIPAAAILMVLAGLVKESLFATPVATTLWFALYRRDRLASWFLWSGVLLAGALAITLGHFGWSFVDNVFMPRHVTPWTFVYNWSNLVKLQVPIALCVLLLLVSPWDDRLAWPMLYLGVSLVFGLRLTITAGANFNHYFDVVIALSIASPFVIERLGSRLASQRVSVGLAQVAIALLLCGPVIDGLPRTVHDTVFRLWRKDWLREQAVSTREDVAVLQAQPGPAICEDLALCYWAGKAYELEPYTWHQKVLGGVASEAELLAALREGRFAVIQLDDWGERRQERFTEAFVAALRQRYRVFRRSPNGFFFEPIPARPPDSS